MTDGITDTKVGAVDLWSCYFLLRFFIYTFIHVIINNLECVVATYLECVVATYLLDRALAGLQLYPMRASARAHWH